MRTLAGAVQIPRIAWSFSRLGLTRRARTFDESALDVSLAGKRCIVTGANAGLGLAIASALAERDADVWLLCRNQQRGERARSALADAGSGTVRCEVVDMADGGSIARLLDRIDLPTVDVLVHNAGALFDDRADAPGGIEQTVALHVVGPQRLTRGLLPALCAADDPRVIYVSSGGMYSERLCIDDLLSPPEPFDGVRAYALAKRAQVCLARLWAESEPGVRFFSMHPGWADTDGVKTALPSFYKATRPWLRTPAQGADTAVWLAVARDLSLWSGAFAFDRAAVSEHMVPGTHADDAELARLWDVVEALARLRHPPGDPSQAS